MYCNKCGKQLPDNASFCDNCGTPVGNKAKIQENGKKKLPVGARIAIIILSILIGVCIGLAVVMIGSGSTTEISSETQTVEATESLLLVNDIAKISYVGMTEAPGVEGMFCINIRTENKTDKEIWVYMDSASIDGMMVTPVSGLPNTIAPGKHSNFAYVVKGNLNDVKEAEFKIVIADYSTMDAIYQSDVITVQK